MVLMQPAVSSGYWMKVVRLGLVGVTMALLVITLVNRMS